MMTAPEVKDKYYLVLIVCYIMGVLTLAPSDFFITAHDYWMYKFRNASLGNFSSETNDENRTSLQANFTSSFSIVCTFSLMCFLGLTAFFGKIFRAQLRVYVGLISMCTFFIINLIFIEIDTDSFQGAFFGISMALAVMLSASAGVTIFSLFEVVAKFPIRYITCILSGQAVCGVLAAIVQIFSISFDIKTTASALVYFGIGTTIVSITILLYSFTIKWSKFFQYHYNKELEAKEKKKLDFAEFKIIMGKAKLYLSTLVITNGSLVMIQPGVTSLVVSMEKGNGNSWNDTYFVPVITFLIYHTVDLIGKEVAARIRIKVNKYVVLSATLLRLMLIPLMLFCNEQPRDHLPVLFNDYGYITLTIILAFSTGFLVNLSIIMIPTTVDEEQREHISILILSVMLIAVPICSVLSLAIVKIL